MSLILEALKRAERERNSVPGAMSSEFSAPAPHGASPFRRWRLVGLIVLIAVSALLAWTFLRDNPKAVVAPIPSAVETPAQDRPAPVAAAPPSPALAVPSVIPGTEAVSSLDDLTTAPLEPEPATSPVAQPAELAARPVPNTELSSQAAEADRAGVATGEAAAKTAATEPALPPALTQPVPLRKFREMPPDYRADFPALTVEVHVYEREPAQRFVMINGRRYRQGERLAEGPALLEIVRDGMVLEFRGEKLLYTLTR